MTAPPITVEVAAPLVRRYLAGLRGYPVRAEGESLLVRTVQECCVSVQHAESVLAVFDHECPTPREIKDAAYNTRERYLPKGPSQREQWEQEYGPPDTAYTDKMRAMLSGIAASDRKNQFKVEFLARKLEALKDAVYYSGPKGQSELNEIVGRQERSAARLFWAQALARDEREYPEQIAAIRAGREPVFPGPPPKVVPPQLRVTEESFRNVEPMPIERCHNCGGSGRLAGDDYCNECQTGRDLRRSESSRGNEQQ